MAKGMQGATFEEEMNGAVALFQRRSEAGTPMSFNRPPAVAGLFYPGDPETLRNVVQKLLADVHDYEADSAAATAGIPQALIVPHAGYRYSGSVAASAFARLQQGRDRIRRVVLLGTAHSRVKGIATTRAAGFETPIGVVPVDPKGVASLSGLANVFEEELAHQADHALEVQLPFLQVLLNKFTIVPLLVGTCPPESVAQVIDRLWQDQDEDRETLVLVSSDLSHYLDYESARQRDRATADSILALDTDRLGSESACGHRAIAGLVQIAQKRKLKAELVDLRNSGDTTGRRDRVVGYGAFLFTPNGGGLP